MISSYIKSAKRILFKDKLYTALHVSGLALGLATCFAIYSWVAFETSFDSHFESAENIYRVSTFSNDPSEGGIASTYPMVKSRMLTQFPEVVESARLFNEGFLGSKTRVRVDDKVFTNVRFYYGDESVLNIFSIKVLAGTQQALQVPNGVILTQTMAKRLFAVGDPIGKSVVVGDGREFQVTAVVEDVPHNSHFHFDMLASMLAHPWIKKAEENLWSGVVFHTYVKLREDASPNTLEVKLKNLLDNFPDDPKQFGKAISLRLQPLRDIHLRSNLKFELEPNGNILYVYVFSTIGILVLVLAIINYVNLATARHLRRYKEVGVRKSMGASVGQLILQFTIESSAITVLAMAIAVIGLMLVKPLLISLLGDMEDMLQAGILMTCVMIAIFTALATGVFPATALSLKKPVFLLKNSIAVPGGFSFRKVLLMMQFTTSIALTICTAVAYRQMNFIGDVDLGFHRDQVVVLNIGYEDMLTKYKVLKTELAANPAIIGSTASSELPTDIQGGENIDITNSQTLGVNCISVDPDFFDVMGIRVLQGIDQIRTLEENDSVNRFVMNENSAHALGKTNEALLNQPMRIRHGNMVPGPVVGIVSDFHFQSLHHAVGPLVLEFNPGLYQYLLVKIQGEDVPKTLEFIASVWAKAAKGIPFEYSFLDEHYNNLYKSEQRSGDLLIIFSGLALAISLLGLFGLTSFAVERRTKEIGIRKILGARVSGLLVLIGRDFLTVLVISFLLAIPIGYLFMHSWLEEFATKIELDPLLFLLAGAANLLCAVLIVSFHGVRIASTRSVDTLREQ